MSNENYETTMSRNISSNLYRRFLDRVSARLIKKDFVNNFRVICVLNKVKSKNEAFQDIIEDEQKRVNLSVYYDEYKRKFYLEAYYIPEFIKPEDFNSFDEFSDNLDKNKFQVAVQIDEVFLDLIHAETVDDINESQLLNICKFIFSGNGWKVNLNQWEKIA